MCALRGTKIGLPQLLRLPPLPSIKDLLRIYKVRATKHLSQNFLLDERYTRKIVKAAGNIAGHYVCEIGAGPGNITRPILEKGVASVTVIEKDRRFLPSLELLQDASYGRMNIILGDIMDHPLANLFPNELSCPWEGPAPACHLIGNLPFGIASAFLQRLLRHCAYRTGPFTSGRVQMVFSFQREVAERLVAPNDHPRRGLLSVICQNLCNVELVTTIPGTAFIPTPEIDVGVVRFRPLVRPLIDMPHDQVMKVISAIFTFRSKHCKRSIATLFPKDRPDLTYEMLKLADVDPTLTPYQLSNDDFSRLCHAYEQLRGPPSVYTLEILQKEETTATLPVHK